RLGSHSPLAKSRMTGHNRRLERSCSLAGDRKDSSAMWTTIALTMALSPMPGQAGELTLSNIRPTHGLLGSERPDSRLLPGDIFFVTFDIDGLKVDDSGTMFYSMAMEVRDSKSKAVYKSEPQDLDMPAPLGGHSLPGFAHVDLGRDMPPGDYTLKVTVTDRAS